MTPTQREAAARLADELQRFDGAERESLRDETAALLRELLAEPVINHKMTTEPAEPQGEPVAWFYRSISGAQFVHFYKNTPRFLADQDAAEQWPDAHSFMPLYTHPPQQRKPFSHAQMADLIRAEWGIAEVPSAWNFGRAIERAHGIVEAP